MNIETKVYTDGTTATGVAPLPDRSPAQQDAEKYVPIATLQEVAEAETTGNKHIDALIARLDRLTAHVNREIGVADEVPLCMKLEAIEKLLNVTREKIKEKTKLLD